MAKLTLKFVIVFVLCLYVSVRFLVPLTGQEFLSRCLATAIWIVASYATAIRMSTGGRVAIQGKAVLITGCDTGMGHALAKRLDQIGFKVFAGCLFAEEGQGARTLREQCSTKLEVIQLDVTSDNQIAQALASVKASLSSSGDVLWGVVNNAGIAVFGNVDLVSMESFKRVMDVNLWGMVRVTRTFLPLLRKSKGRIVNMSSMLGRTSPPYCAPYCMTKYAVQSFTDTLRLEMYQWDIKAVIVEPGTFSAGESVMLQENTLNQGFDSVWKFAPQELKEVYGEEHFQSAKLFLIRPVLITSHSSIAPVVDVYTSALIDKNPRDRYFPSNTLCKCIAWAQYYLPATITDACYFLYMNFISKPQGFKSS